MREAVFLCFDFNPSLTSSVLWIYPFISLKLHLINCTPTSYVMKFIPSLVATIGLCGIPVLSSSLSDGSVEVHDMIVKTFQHASTFIDLTLASFAGNELPNLDDRNIVMDAQIYNTTIYDLMGTQKSNKKGKSCKWLLKVQVHWIWCLHRYFERRSRSRCSCKSNHWTHSRNSFRHVRRSCAT